MNITTFVRAAAALVLAAFAGLAFADPPSRVARLSVVVGSASYSPDQREWGRANVNRPLVTGDSLWVPRGGRAELQMGTAAVRLGGGTSLGILNLDDRITQLQLSQGTLNIRVRRIDRGEVFEIATPNLAFLIRRPGSYRVEVDARGDATLVATYKGMGQAYGEGRAFVIGEGRVYRFYDTGLSDYETFTRVRPDELDRWAAERDRRWDNSPSRRFVSVEMIGYEDLDQHGTWRKVPEYGNVWVPRRVSADWAPYRNGHWSWIEPWGWTWVDDAPWGFAPSHYGRWARIDTAWAWVPGPATVRPVYAPAVVAFVGGTPAAASGGPTVAWFPLAPREVYRPTYTVSAEYFRRINVSNTVVQPTVVETYYRAPPANVTYVNQQVPGALIAMLAAAFVQSRPVANEVVRIAPAASQRPVTIVAAPPVAPVKASVMGGSAESARPPEDVRSRRVVAQTEPPRPRAPFESRQKALADSAGKQLDSAAITAAAPPAAPAAAPPVKIVQPTEPVTAPPRPGSSAPRAAASGPQAPASAAASAPGPTRPGRPTPPASQAQPAPPAASAPAPASPASAAAPAASREQRDERRGQREGRPDRPAREAASAPLPSLAPTPAASAAPAAPPAAAPAPAASREQRDERRGQREGRPDRPAREAATAPLPSLAPTPAASAAPAAPPAAAPAPAASREQRDERRGQREGRPDRPGRDANPTPPVSQPAAPAAPAAATPPPPPAPAAAPAPTPRAAPPAAAPASAPAAAPPAPPGGASRDERRSQPREPREGRPERAGREPAAAPAPAAPGAAAPAASVPAEGRPGPRQRAASAPAESASEPASERRGERRRREGDGERRP